MGGRHFEQGAEEGFTLVAEWPGSVLSAFSGAGGLDLGLEHAGFDVVGCLETDEAARRTLAVNRPDWEVIDDGDVMTAAARLSPADLGLDIRQLGLLAGGPPCQPFSKAGQWAPNGRGGMSDVGGRGTAIDGMMGLVDRFLPQAVMIENVVGFVRGRGSALQAMEGALRAVNDEHGTAYRLQVRQVDAADYGVPQHRVRAIAVALRDGADVRWPEATHPEGSRTTCWDAIGELAESDLPVATGKWAALLPSIPEGCNYQWHTDRGGGEPLFGYRTRYWSFLLKLARDSPSWTISANPGPSSGPFHWDNRPLTVLERLRLQSFPRSWALEGTLRDQIRLVGNAAPPLLSEVIGRALVEQLFSARPETARPALDIPPSSVPSVACSPRPVSDEFHALIGDHPAHPGEGKGPGAEARASARRAAMPVLPAAPGSGVPRVAADR